MFVDRIEVLEYHQKVEVELSTFAVYLKIRFFFSFFFFGQGKNILVLISKAVILM